MKVTYIEGDAGTMAGQVEGGGVLVINGDAHISGQFVYAGLVIVLGDLVVSGGGNNGMHSLGAVLVKGEVDLRGNSAIWWSERIIDDVLKLTEYPPSIRYGSKTWTTLTKGDVEWMGY